MSNQQYEALYKGKRHYDKNGKPLGGIKVMVDDSYMVEVEGGEYKICNDAYNSDEVLSFNSKTNKEILDYIHGNFSCKFEQSKAKSGDFILCRLVVNDEKKKKYSGTVRQILDAMQSEHSCRVSFGDKSMKKGGEISPEEIEERWNKKKEHIEKLSEAIRSLRNNLTRDIKGDDEKERLTALAISVIDKTAERVGNGDSEQNGHFGVTGFQKNHIKVDGNTVYLNYVGKSGVKHEKQFSDELISAALKNAMNESSCNFVFCTKDGFRIKPDKINRYLSDYGITAKDIRGYSANRWIVDRLNNIEEKDIPETEAKRKRKFNKILKSVAAKVGHGSGTLKKHYMIPELETTFIQGGEILNLSSFYSKGGYVRLSKTPAPKSERIYGSSKNAPKSAASKDSGKNIELSSSIVSSILNKLKEHNSIHKDKRVTIGVAKAVVRRGMGAYSATHRPTIKGGQPNSRVAWGLARLNAFLIKAATGKSKSGRYSQDNDLLDELNIPHEKYENGGNFKRQVVGNIIYSKNQGFLFLQRADDCEKNSGKWHILSGGVEDGESLEVAAKREFVEEVGYNGEIEIEKLQTIDFKNYEFTYFLIMPKKPFNPKLDFENKDYKWVYSIDEMLNTDLIPELKEYLISFNEGFKNSYAKGGRTFNDKKLLSRYKRGEKIGFTAIAHLKSQGLIERADGTIMKTMSKGGLLAPNGKSSNLTPEQYKLVRTPAFKKWFGDWEKDPENASKVVDSNGEPLVVYHGTNAEFWKFEKSKGKGNIKQKSINFSSDKKVAENYGNRIITCFLNLKHPLIKNYNGENYHTITFDARYENRINDIPDFIVNNAQSEKKYDGVIFLNIQDSKSAYDKFSVPIANNYYAFNNRQIKLADGTNTTFDGNNPDIRYAYGGSVDKNCIDFIKKTEAILKNGYYHNFGSFCFITYNSGNQKDLNIYQTVNLILSKSLSELLKIDEESAKKLISNYYDNARRFDTLDIINELKGCNIVIADRDKIVCANNMQNDKGGEIENLISQGVIDLKFYETTPEHAKEYGIKAIKPIFVQNLCVSEKHRLKGIGNKVLEYIESYAQNNGNDVIFGYVADNALFSKDSRQSYFCDADMVKNWLQSKGYAINDDNNDFHKAIKDDTNTTFDANNPDIRFGIGGNILLAPNGKPSNLTPEQWHLVRTPAFKAWFGDWERLVMATIKDPAIDEVTLGYLSKDVSKVVDDNGEPKIWWRAETSGDNEDETFYTVKHNGSMYSEDEEYIKYYYPVDGINKPYFIKREKIFDIQNKIDFEKWVEKFGYFYSERYYSPIPSEQFKGSEPKNLTDYYDFKKNSEEWASNSGVIEPKGSWISSNGYDGFYSYEGGIRNIYLFGNMGIKLADGTNTTFDGNNPDIRFDNGGEITLLKNKTKAPYFDKMYGQDVEPTGYYAIKKETDIFDSNPNYETKKIRFENPLYIEVDADTLISWKNDLSKKFKAKGKKLTEKLLNEGYDIIITRYSNGDTGEIIVLDTDILKMNQGGKLSEENHAIYQKWKKLVNMTAAELEKFYNSEEGKDAGLKPKEAKDLGIHYGRESARWIIKMKKTPITEWTPEMWEWAKRQINFNTRMLGNKGGLYDEKGEKTRKHTSLLIWGHNPEKKEEGGIIYSVEEMIMSLNKSPFLKVSQMPNGKISFSEIENGTDAIVEFIDSEDLKSRYLLYSF